MEYYLKNKVIVVTGGANGIGYEIVDKYLEQEAKIAVILDIDEVRGKEAEKTLTEKYGFGKVDFIQCDVVTDLERVSEIIIGRYKTVDVLVLNAGIVDESVPKKLIDILLTSMIEWSMKFLEYISKENGGNGGTFIINSSIFGFRTIPFAPVYQAAKFGAVGFAKSLGHEYNFKKTGVRVVAICPGFTETNLSLPLFDPKLKKMFPNQDLMEFAHTYHWQKVDAVGKAAVEIFKRAGSGTIWIIEGEELKEML